MFKDNCGNISSTKIMAFIGFFAFLVISAYVLHVKPELFDYRLFAILSGGGAVGTRIVDKIINVKASEEKK